MSEDIHSLVVYAESDLVVSRGLDLELEVVADIIETSENIPYIGSLIKLGKVGFSIYGFHHYYKKLAHFLKHAIEIPLEEREKFIQSWDPTMRKKAAEYVCAVLSNAEDTDKADILGFIYKARLNGEIDDNLMLRLISVVNKVFVQDLRQIDFFDPSISSDIIIEQLHSCGICYGLSDVLQDEDVDHNSRKHGSLSWLLNDTGKVLYDILKKNKWPQM